MVSWSVSLVDIEYLLLILVRISAFMFSAPLYGQTGVPGRAKIGLSFCISILLHNMVPHPDLAYVSVIGYAVCILKEGITGLLIGFAANICNSIVLFAGNIIDMDIGLSMATEFNPDTQMQITISGNLYYYFVLLLLIVSDMHIYILRAACDSFSVVPIGGAQFQWEHLSESMIRYMGDLFVIGFRIFLPFFATIMILNCVLGIMAKVAPQMNMFSVGIQMKLIVGLIVMFLTVFLLPSISNFIFNEIKQMVVLIIEGLYT